MEANPTPSVADARRARPSALQPIEAARIPDALLMIPTACAVTGLSPATLYRKAATDPTFPKLIRLGSRCTRIRAGDLTAWLAAQAAKAA
jgi:prophage regulatory protein